MRDRPPPTPGETALLIDVMRAAAGDAHAHCVASLWPLEGEPDLRPLAHALHGAGRQVALPETTPRGHPLRFRRWTPDTPMRPGRFGTRFPDGPYAEPDLIFVPLLCFDRRGFRLGYGGGYYDRTLAERPDARAIGFAFSRQEVAFVPTGPYDVALDHVATEHGVITCAKGA
ncbi:5-formyltetrahydrofolate cyclo-ligase [Ameyamaea chiangmaiensis]|nr:5-formyltetrahydrofolate cyclo-ligase [Ameyamaea chiangmaiensis]MBS4075220.1 5-formyltetrahydrofolate cyclo-ligase [Ameyamaea chiangmaiensis]